MPISSSWLRVDTLRAVGACDPLPAAGGLSGERGLLKGAEDGSGAAVLGTVLVTATEATGLLGCFCDCATEGSGRSGAGPLPDRGPVLGGIVKI